MPGGFSQKESKSKPTFSGHFEPIDGPTRTALFDPAKATAILAWETEQKESGQPLLAVRGQDGLPIEVTVGDDDKFAFIANKQRLAGCEQIEDGVNVLIVNRAFSGPYDVQTVQKIFYNGREKQVYILTGIPLGQPASGS